MALQEISFEHETVLIFFDENNRDSVLAFRELLYLITDRNTAESSIEELQYFSVNVIANLKFNVFHGDTVAFILGAVAYRDIRTLIEEFDNKNIFWFCNDTTCVQVAQANDIGNLIRGIRTTIPGLTLADLVYLHFYTDIKSDAHGTLYHENSPDMIYNEANSSELMLHFPSSFMEKYRTALFFQGKILSEPEDFQIKQIEQWIEHICKIDPVLYEYADDFIENNNRGMETFFDMNQATISTALYLGSILFSNISREYMNVYRESSFPVQLKKFPQYSVVAINYSRATKDIFLYGVDEYELGLLFWYDNRHMHYKIYRLGANPDKFISCKTIAESFGGHGSYSEGTFSTWDSTLIFESVF